MFSFLLNPFRALFGSPPPPPSPAPAAPVRRVSTPPPTCPPDLAARVDRAVSRLVDLDRLYGLGHFNDRNHEKDWRHDLKVMAAHRDLKQVRMELLDRGDHVVASLTFPFDGRPVDREFDDLVTPLIPRQAVAKVHILVTYNTGHARDAYRRHLRLKWTPAQQREAPDGGDFGAGSAAPGRITLRAQDRHALIVRDAFWDRGYAHAFTPDLPGASVFVHAAYCPDGFRPPPGQPLTAHLVQTQRGLQARDVRPA